MLRQKSMFSERNGELDCEYNKKYQHAIAGIFTLRLDKKLSFYNLWWRFGHVDNGGSSVVLDLSPIDY